MPPFRSTSMRNVVIVDACRTAVGSFGGSLRPLKADALARAVMIAALERTGLEPGQVDEIFLGHCRQSSDCSNTARYAALLAGIPETVPASTVMCACASGMLAVNCGFNAIRTGQDQVQCYFLSVRRSLGSGYGNHSAEGLSHGGPILFPAPGHLWQVQHGYYGRKYCR